MINTISLSHLSTCRLLPRGLASLNLIKVVLMCKNNCWKIRTSGEGGGFGNSDTAGQGEGGLKIRDFGGRPMGPLRGFRDLNFSSQNPNHA